MNRAERRREQKKAEKKERDASYNPTRYEKAYDEGFQKGYKAGVNIGTARSIRLFATAMISSVRCEYGFGHDRMLRLLEMTYATLQDIADDPEHEVKLRKWIEEKCGINLDDHTGCGGLDINV